MGAKNKRGQVFGALLLILAALIWGTSFVAQDVGMDYLGPFTFNGIRSLVGCTALLPLLVYRSLLTKRAQKAGRTERRTESKGWTVKEKRPLLRGGILCGLVLCTASNLQQVGIRHSTVGKAGFLTTLYIVIVPLLGLLRGKIPRPVMWVSVAVAMAGIYALSFTGEGEGVSLGDILLLLCAVFYAFHILAVDRYAPKVNGVALSCIQFLISGVITMVLAFLFETPNPGTILSAWFPILYAGVMSSAIAYTLQIIGQRYVNPVAAPVIMSLESVFAVLSGWLVLGQTLQPREWLGCGLVFGAVLLAEYASREKSVK